MYDRTCLIVNIYFLVYSAEQFVGICNIYTSTCLCILHTRSENLCVYTLFCCLFCCLFSNLVKYIFITEIEIECVSGGSCTTCTCLFTIIVVML